MALDQPTGDLRGILVPFPSLLGAPMWATTQAGPIAGAPEAGQPTEMVVEGSGVLTEGARAEVYTVLAGHPRPGSATFRWKVSADPNADYRSFDPPWVLTGWEYVSRSTTSGYWSKFHAATLHNGRVVCVAVRETNKVYVWRETSTGAFSSALVEDTGHATTACIAVGPGGRVYIWYTYYLTIAAMTVKMAYSDDDGATWTAGSSNCINRQNVFTAATSTIERIRVGLVGGDALLVIWRQAAGTDTVYQYASDDGGCTFTPVETSSSANMACPDLAVLNRIVYLVTIEQVGGLYVPYLRILTSVVQSIASTPAVLAVDDTGTAMWGIFSGGVFTNSECAVTFGDDGGLYLYGAHFVGGRSIVLSVSYDNGQTWLASYDNGHSASTSMPIWMDDASTYLRDYTVALGRGRVALFHRHASTGTSADDSLSVAWLGGWSTVAQPEDETVAYQLGVVPWTLVYLPIDLPEDVGAAWTAVTTGAPTVAVGANGIHVTQAIGEAQSWYMTPDLTGYEADGVLVEREMDPISGTLFLSARISDTTDCFHVSVEVTTTGITLKDEHGATIDSTVVATTAGLRVRLALEKGAGAWSSNVGAVAAWYQILSVSGASPQDRLWIPLGSSAALVSAPGATNDLRWGIRSGAGEGTFGWLGTAYGGALAGNGLAVAAAGPTRGHYFPGPMTPAHLYGGLRIHALSGPTVAGDWWTLEEAYRYPVESVDVSVAPSPRVRWRSTSEAAHQVVWYAECGIPTGTLIGLYLEGINWRTGALYGGALGADKICDIDTAIQTGLAFTRTYDCVYPTGGAGTSAPFYLHEESLVGGTFRYTVGGTVRKILHNTAGQWLLGAASGNRGTRLYLDGAESGDTASGTTGILCPDRVLILTDVAASSAIFSLHIDAQDTVEGYFTIGAAMIGRVQVFGQEYGQNRSREWRPRYALTEGPSGVRSSRVSGPLRRTVEIAWDDPIDLSQASLTTTAADYVTLGYVSAPPVASRGYDLPDTLGGILSGTGGATVPVVYIPALPQAASAPTTAAPIVLTDSSRFLYARMMSETVRADTVFGNEYRSPDGEGARISKVRFEEEK